MEKKLLNEELYRIKYLFEHKRGRVISEQTEVRQGAKGDPYQYKKEGDKYFYAKKGTESWTEQTNKKGIEAIKTKIFDNAALAPKTTQSTPAQTAPEYYTATGINVRSVYDQLAKGKEKMNNEPFQTFAYKTEVEPGKGYISGTDGISDTVLGNIGRVLGVASKISMNEFKQKFTEFANYTYVTTPQGGFGPNTDPTRIFDTVKTKPTQTAASTDTQNNQQAPTQTNTKNDPEVQANLDNEKTIEEWCDTNEVYYDEGCYPVIGMSFNEARKKSYNDAKEDNRIHKRGEEFWDEGKKIYIAIYGSKSRKGKELRKRKEEISNSNVKQGEEQQPTQQQIYANTQTSEPKTKTPNYDGV